MAIGASNQTQNPLKQIMKNRAVQTKPQQGMALPTVMALFMVSSVILLASWRNITLAHGWSRYQVERWQLQQAGLNALTTTAESIVGQTVSPSNSHGEATLAFPSNLSEWSQLQNQLPVNGCSQGICRPLLHAGNGLTDWLKRNSQAKTLVTESGQKIWSWVEVIPAALNINTDNHVFMYRITTIAMQDGRGTQAGWQAVWQFAAMPLPGQPVRLADMQRVLELLP